MSKRHLTLDLHPVYNKGELIDQALEDVMQQAQQKKIAEVEIICGKGKGQLKKKVLRFLNRKDVKGKYHRLEKDAGNWGRIFVYFRWK
jgi:DNA-nicking Smr family endonuclease